jgi:hypothetical protein
MADRSFFSKVLSYLSELNKGKHSLLIDNGLLSLDDAYKINLVLSQLGFIEKKGKDYQLTSKGLSVLLYYKMGKMTEDYDESVLRLLLDLD